MEHNIRRIGDVTIVDLDGRISLTDTLWSGGVKPLSEVVRGLVKNGERKILLNLVGVTYVDSSGMGELMSALTSVQRQGGQLKLLNLSPRVTDLLRIARLDTLFDIKEEENSAIQSFSRLPLAAAG